jgi:hypothetical protein
MKTKLSLRLLSNKKILISWLKTRSPGVLSHICPTWLAENTVIYTILFKSCAENFF